VGRGRGPAAPGVAEEDTNYEDLQALIEDVLDFAERSSRDFDITIEPTIGGDVPPGGTVEDVLDALGTDLPEPATGDKR
jgi:hypothetical protein